MEHAFLPSLFLFPSHFPPVVLFPVYTSEEFKASLVNGSEIPPVLHSVLFWYKKLSQKLVMNKELTNENVTQAMTVEQIGKP